MSAGRSWLLVLGTGGWLGTGQRPPDRLLPVCIVQCFAAARLSLASRWWCWDSAALLMRLLIPVFVLVVCYCFGCWLLCGGEPSCGAWPHLDVICMNAAGWRVGIICVIVAGVAALLRLVLC